jgi:ABC-type dipeptide/oligopeptide/nickel transport system permease subunit
MKHTLPITGVLLLGFFVLGTLLAHWGIIATDYNQVLHELSYRPPSQSYWFGNDIFGRNVLARGWHAGYTALSVGFVAAVLATFIGVFLGALAGYFGGWLDALIVWFFTTLESIPYILLLAAFAFVLGQGLINVYISLGLTSWVVICRLVRAEVIQQKTQEYVQAARGFGVGEVRILVQHILPNIFHIVIVQFGLIFIFAVKAEVILSFLGLGVEPGFPSWGFMLDESKQELSRGIWWNFACASILMFILVFSLQVCLEFLRERLDIHHSENKTP